MAHRHVVTVHRAGAAMADFARRQMGDDLMAVKIEIDPFGGRASLRATQQSAIKRAGAGQVVDGKSEMEKRLCHMRYPVELNLNEPKRAF